jgi:hypothetical protein
MNWIKKIYNRIKGIPPIDFDITKELTKEQATIVLLNRGYTRPKNIYPGLMKAPNGKQMVWFRCVVTENLRLESVFKKKSLIKS